MKPMHAINKYAELMGVGIEMAASMALPLLLGIWLDNKYDSSPWGVLGGVLFGLLALGVKLYKLSLRANTLSRYKKKTPNEIKNE